MDVPNRRRGREEWLVATIPQDRGHRPFKLKGLTAGREQKQDEGRERVIMCGCVQLVSIPSDTYPLEPGIFEIKNSKREKERKGIKLNTQWQ
jgi:hypothetical protein